MNIKPNMGNTVCNKNDNRDLEHEECSRQFNETFADVDFVGMSMVEAYKIIRSRGYEKMKLCIQSSYRSRQRTQKRSQEVIIVCDDECIVVKQPIYL